MGVKRCLVPTGARALNLTKTILMQYAIQNYSKDILTSLSYPYIVMYLREISEKPKHETLETLLYEAITLSFHTMMQEIEAMLVPFGFFPKGKGSRSACSMRGHNLVAYFFPGKLCTIMAGPGIRASAS